VVGEFPKLQGIMGRIYAEHAGERKTVGAAVEEHYLPTYSGGSLPRTDAGAILGIADKVDSICGCFSAGLIPTGASDPYALRRQGIGIVQIMLKKGFSFSIRDLVAESMSLFAMSDSEERDENVGKVYAFLRNRMAHILAEEGFSKDVISAVTSVSVDHVPGVWEKVKALEKLKSEPDFEPLAIAFKRVVNIIKKADNMEKVDVDESLFEDECEGDLYASFREVRNQALADFSGGSIDAALIRVSSLRDPVDSFFDGVMVMADDDRLRNNRLALLGEIAGLFGVFADFSKIST
jgi:glycyl-tRNA synthetase beta chain